MLKKCLFLTVCFATGYLSAQENSTYARYQMSVVSGGEYQANNPYVYILDNQTGYIWRGHNKVNKWSGHPECFEWEQLPPLPVQEIESSKQ